MGVVRVMRLLHGFFLACSLAAAPAAAQQTIPFTPSPQTIPQPKVPTPDMSNAYQTRQMFHQMLRQYPGFLSEVFQLDPSLLTNQGFLSAYPNLAEFLAQHPEIVRNPSFFVGENSRSRRLDTPEERSQEMMENLISRMAAFTAVVIALSVLCWLVKTAIDHRRWLRISKVQSEVHSKLLDRFTSNQDLLTYIQTSAGKHFLESAPISIDPASPTLGAPMNRILFSVQAGIILASAGVGLHLVGRTFSVQETAQPLFVLSALAMALGVGFVLSALIAYVMSRRLGLLNNTPLTSTSENAGVSPPNA